MRADALKTIFESAEVGVRTLWIQSQGNGRSIIDYKLFSSWPPRNDTDEIAGPFEHPDPQDVSLIGVDNMPDIGSLWAVAVGYKPTLVNYQQMEGVASNAPLRIHLAPRANAPRARMEIQWSDLVNGEQLQFGDIIRLLPQVDGMSLVTAANVTWTKRADIWDPKFGIVYAAETHGGRQEAVLVPPGTLMLESSNLRLTLWKVTPWGQPDPTYGLTLPRNCQGQISWEMDY